MYQRRRDRAVAAVPDAPTDFLTTKGMKSTKERQEWSEAHAPFVTFVAFRHSTDLQRQSLAKTLRAQRGREVISKHIE